jgi:hypothetical protein
MIESLEPRIAPAAIAVGNHVATWTDYDGDIVTMKWSVGGAPVFVTQDIGAGLLVNSCTLSEADHTFAKFSITVKTAGGGDGRVEMGDFHGTDVVIGGLVAPKVGFAHIEYGKEHQPLGPLIIGGFGQQRPEDFGGLANTESVILGEPSTVKIMGDFGYGHLSIYAKNGNIPTVFVGGSILGNLSADGYQGIFYLRADKVKSVVVKGSIVADRTPSSSFYGGSFAVSADIASFSLGGSVVGGRLGVEGNVKSLNIAGSIIGGSKYDTGVVWVSAAISTYANKIVVGGSIMGGSEGGSGVLSVQHAGSILVKGDIIGGDMVTASQPLPSAAVTAHQVKTITIKGGLHAGGNVSGTPNQVNGAIVIYRSAETITVGSMHGTPDVRARIVGCAGPGVGSDRGIGDVIVKGDISYGMITVGQFTDAGSIAGPAELRDASIRSVTVGGDFHHSSIMAAVDDLGVEGASPTDTRTPGQPGKISRIDAVTIKGRVTADLGLFGAGGIEGESIGSVTVGGVQVFKHGDPLRNLNASGTMFIREI